MNPTRRLSLLACALGVLGATTPSTAQSTYPDKPVKIMVALPAGGGVDMIARVIGEKLAAAMGQPFVVDNRAGASGRIGLQAVAKAPADGYTLLVTPASFLTTNQHLFKDMPYDAQADFAPITKLVNQSVVLVVRDRQKFATAAAVLAAARAKPESVNYATSGDGSLQHLAALMFETRNKVRMTHIPYKGGALALNDLLGGNVDMLFAPVTEALPHVKAGKLVALAVMSDQRSALIPEVPTMREAGIPDMEFQTWIGVLAPARTPRPLVDQLNRQIHAILASDEIRNKLRETAMDVAPTTPEQLARTILDDSRLHAELVKAAGLAPQ